MKNHVKHEVTALCEKENRIITVDVPFSIISRSVNRELNTPFHEVHASVPACAEHCILSKQNGCSVIKKARGIKSI